MFLLAIGVVACVACLLLVGVGLYCCRQKCGRRSGRAGYVAGKKSEVKPPDLWIDHPRRLSEPHGPSPSTSMPRPRMNALSW